MNYKNYIEDNTIRCEAGYRGGGIEINAESLFPYIEDARLTAYQNYLGGGLLGCVCSDSNFEDEVKSEDRKKFDTLVLELKKYFHSLTNHEGDIWEETSFEEDQTRPVSAY